jgi:hypothetical protein
MYKLKCIEVGIGDYSPTLYAELYRKNKEIATIRNTGEGGDHKISFDSTKEEVTFLKFCFDNNTNVDDFINSLIQR